MEDNHFDTQMENGWRKMKIVLDHELPTKKKKRKIIFLILMSLLGLGLIIFYFSYKIYKAQNYMPLPEHDEVIAFDQLNEVDKTNSNQLYDTSYVKVSAPKIEYIINHERKLKIDKGFGQITQRKQHTNREISNVNKPNNYEAKVINSESPFFNQNLISESQRNDDSVFLLKESAQFNELFVSPIQSIKSNLVFTNVFLLKPKSNLKNGQYPLQLGLSISTTSHDYHSFLNVQTGVFFDKYISEKWKLMSGLRWKRFLRNSTLYSTKNNDSSEMINGSISEVGKFDINYTNLDLNSAALVDMEILNRITDYVDYIEIQLGCGFQLNKQIELNVGMNLSTKLASSYSSFQDFPKELEDLKINELSQEMIQKAQPLHKKYLTSLNSGVTTKLGKQLSFTTQVSYLPFNNEIVMASTSTNLSPGLNLALLNKQKPDFKFGIELGLKYLLYQK